MTEETCFAYYGAGCAILTELLCKSGSCPFYATKAERRERLLASMKRRRGLGLPETEYDRDLERTEL